MFSKAAYMKRQTSDICEHIHKAHAQMIYVDLEFYEVNQTKHSIPVWESKTACWLWKT